MGILEYYKTIKNSVQLFDAELIKLNCSKNESLGKKGHNEGEKLEVKITLNREVKLISDSEAYIYLHSEVGITDGPFNFEITYRGLCLTREKIDESSFEEYAYNQVVPLLLPYVRECVSSTMARMGLPIFTLPTIDVLNTMEANLKTKEIVEE
ncbi:protein-export chaperone SecB [Sporosarcina sp. ITBMC105]